MSTYLHFEIFVSVIFDIEIIINPIDLLLQSWSTFSAGF